MDDGEPIDYLEAFPAFEMVEAARAQRRPRWVTWFNETRQIVGWGQVRWGEFTIDLTYTFNRLDTGLPVAGRKVFRTDVVPRGSHGYRLYALCRFCGKYVYRLFFRLSDWFCQDCQSLRHRSTFLSPQLRWQEEYNQLRLEVGNGRPFAMRELRYGKLRARMAELKSKLDGSGRSPGPQYFRLVFAEWSDKEPQD